MVSQRLVTMVFAATMGVAGFLLFQVQPVMAKFILPWFGGSATTWIVCMLFFQLALLIGYAYAFAVTRPFPLKTQALAQVVLLVVMIALLPITPADAWKPLDASNPVGRILALLALSVGAPYAVLATTSPLLQRWLVNVDPTIDVSRLFAVSNFGSFLGLLSYPFLFEPLISSPEQTRWWSHAFVVYAALFALCAALVLRFGKREGEAARDGIISSETRRDAFGAWIVYSALGSVLLLATTNQITQWSAVVPFLWIVPLSLYLLTFVIAFGNQRFYHRTLYAIVFLALSVLTFYLARPESSADLLVQVGLHAATMFAGCMICHAEMVRLQPLPRRLPTFYMTIAFGGALGGVLVALIAPLVFRDYWEHGFVIAAVGAIAVWLVLQARTMRRWERPAVAAVALLFAVGLAGAAYLEFRGEANVLERARNFYGVVKVMRIDVGDPLREAVVMQQAGVDQGWQSAIPDKRRVPACAFNATSGVGRAIFNHRKRRADPNAPLRIGIVGMGAAMLAAHGKPGDALRYYEINPAVADLEAKYFTFRKDSAASKIDVVLGDGRILLEREAQSGAQRFDVLAIDAFRGASPPMHLMTQEAFEIYLKHLEPDGIIAVNFELDTFELAPLHRGLAAKFGLDVRWFETPDVAGGPDDCTDVPSWALYTRDKGLFETPSVKAAASPWRDGKTTELLWTDRSSNLMSIINWPELLGTE